MGKERTETRNWEQRFLFFHVFVFLDCAFGLFCFLSGLYGGFMGSWSGCSVLMIFAEQIRDSENSEERKVTEVDYRE